MSPTDIVSAKVETEGCGGWWAFWFDVGGNDCERTEFSGFDVWTTLLWGWWESSF